MTEKPDSSRPNAASLGKSGWREIVTLTMGGSGRIMRQVLLHDSDGYTVLYEGDNFAISKMNNFSLIID